MEDYLLTIVNVVGVVQALFVIAAVRYLPGKQNGANRTLSLLLLTFSLMFSYDVLYHNDVVVALPSLVFARFPLIFLFGPLFWLYLVRVTGCETAYPHRRRELLHFVPFAVVTLAYVPAVSLSHDQLLQIMNYPTLKRQYGDAFGLNLRQQWLWSITTMLRMPIFVLQFLAYLIAGVRLLMQHSERTKQHFSYTEKINLHWVRYLLLMAAFMWLLVPAKEFLFGPSVSDWLNHFLVVAQVVFVFLVGLFGLLQTTIYPDSGDLPELAAVAPDAVTGKYQGSSLTSTQLLEGLAKLQTLMHQQKPYLNSELTLAELAGDMEVSSRHLSQLINAGLGKNFLDFINGYRVEAAKQYLEDASNDASILTIAMEVGFNSKSAFYNAFKRQLQVTPTQYRQRRLTTLSPSL